MFAAFQTHYDDDDGCAVWRSSNSSRGWEWFRTSPPTRYRNRRRFDGDRDPDALHHSRGLPVYGPLPRPDQRRQETAPSAGRGSDRGSRALWLRLAGRAASLFLNVGASTARRTWCLASLAVRRNLPY